MATLNVQGTKFTFSVLPIAESSDGYWARTEIGVENEYIKYYDVGERVARNELEECLFAASRLLAGAYAQDYAMSFEKAGLAIDFYPYTKNGEEVSRQERREHDCVMAIRLLMLSTQGNFLGGVYSILLHREEIETFVSTLTDEFASAFSGFEKTSGKYLFVGVSPLGYKGCNYWYLDPTKSVVAGEYVWVRMGRHNTEQIVYVDSVKYFEDDAAPYDPAKVKQVLRKATKEDLRNI